MIINLTQHPATPEQIAAGVVDLPAAKKGIQHLLTFEEFPTRQRIQHRAEEIAYRAQEFAIENWLNVAKDAPRWTRDYATALVDLRDRFGSENLLKEINLTLKIKALLGGAPYLMAPLENELRKIGIAPFYAFDGGGFVCA